MTAKLRNSRACWHQHNQRVDLLQLGTHRCPTGVRRSLAKLASPDDLIDRFEHNIRCCTASAQTPFCGLSLQFRYYIESQCSMVMQARTRSIPNRGSNGTFMPEVYKSQHLGSTTQLYNVLLHYSHLEIHCLPHLHNVLDSIPESFRSQLENVKKLAQTPAFDT